MESIEMRDIDGIVPNATITVPAVAAMGVGSIDDGEVGSMTVSRVSVSEKGPDVAT